MKAVCVRQHDQSDCGAAALATVAKAWGRSISVQQLRDLAGTDRIGTNMLGMVEAARRLGFDAKGVKGPYEALGEVPLPAIAHVVTKEGLGHFVVLFELGTKRLVVADPAHGIEKWTPDEFRARWSGYLLLISPREEAVSVTAAKTPWGRIGGLLSAHRRTLAEAFVCATFVTLLGIASSFYVQQLIDSILLHQETKLLDLVGVGMAFLLAFKVVFGVIRQYLLAHMSRKIDLGLLRQYFGHILRMPMQFFESRRVGEILSRVHDASRIRQVVSGVTISIVLDGVFAIGAIVVLFFYSWKLALVGLIFVPVFLASIASHLPFLKKNRRKMMEEGAVLESRLVEDVTGVDAVKAFAIEEERTAKTESSMVRFLRQIYRGEMCAMSLSGFSLLLSGLASLVTLWYGGSLVMAGTITAGQLMFCSTIMGFMVGPMERLAGLNLQIQDAVLALDRLGEILDLPAEAAGRSKIEGIRRGIRLEKVTFRYGCREAVLQEIDLEIPAGKTVAIVGESGSGKSTLCKLLSGFYVPTSGRILVDGIDTRDCDLASLRGKIGWVQQEPFVFSGTIAENVALARSSASAAEIAQAAQWAQLDGFVERLPERYQTVVGERGLNLSGGQRQRLAIARALLRRPELLIFDEATSHLDTKTERAIQETLARCTNGLTTVIVAHRLSTVRNADLIVVVDRGRIVERGTHEELIERAGLYRELWSEQQGFRRAA